MFGPGEEFLGAQSTTIFFFFLINGSSKESKPSEAHPRIFFLSLLLLPMTRVNPIELFFYGRFRLLLIEQKSLRHCLHETMSTSWKLRRKSLTVIIVLGGRLERRKELVGRFESSLRWRDGSQRWWERTFDWIVRTLSSRRLAWNPEMQNLSFRRNLFVGSENYFRRRFISS